MAQKNVANCMKVSPVLIFMLLFQVAGAQYNFAELDKKLESYQKQLGGNVVAIVYKDSQVVYKKEMGEFKANTVAPIASCSKWLTAALVMTFVDEGKLSLDDKVSKYIPEFTNYGKGYITIRQCLSHTTGIENGRPGLGVLLENSKYESLEKEVNEFMGKRDIFAQPGQQFAYSTVGLNIAGRVLEVISKRQFDQLMMQRIFRPLNMKMSTFYSERAVNPSGGAKSTAADYMNFLVMLLNKGNFNGKRILSEQSIAEMQKAQTTQNMIRYSPDNAKGLDYALGEWVLEKDSNGNSTSVTSPGLFGTWPWVDNCRGYACIIFVRNLKAEDRRDMYTDIKKVIDAQLSNKCK
ncbi:beta-lactamase family protein [Panacibacter sp. DH6]|uniref:Beta-lactamase family protein n=1 Tax=Panacibacter microcysteis TaxID=2793269 RepID=A0A931E3G8_9BACT|nr:serine hydrolase domain-containing protein [Panacibacter microcysteis]MBG9374871.1 beta-lactamase family protein [Panacibacter microcysteis]